MTYEVKIFYKEKTINKTITAESEESMIAKVMIDYPSASVKVLSVN